MKFRKLLDIVFLLMLFSGAISYAQFTSVTATITDTDSQTWNNGTWSATLFNPFPQSPPSINGTPLTTSQLNLSGTLSGSGVLTATMADNSVVAPAGTYWQFVIKPNASVQASTATSPVSGSTLNLSSSLSSQVKVIRFPASPTSYGYLDGEVAPTPNPGGIYYNVTTPIGRVWTGSAWTNSGGGSSGATITATTKVIKGDNTGNGIPVVCGSGVINFDGSCASVVSGINTVPGAFTFNGPDVDCAGTTCTFSTAGAPLSPSLISNVILDYNYSQQSGTITVDSTGNGNNGILGTGGNAPTWLSNGLQFNAGSDDFVSMPAAANAGKTFSYTFYYTPISTSPGGPSFNSNFSPIQTSSLGSSGINFIFSAPGGDQPEFFGQPAIWNSNLKTEANNFSTGLHNYTYVLGTGGGDLIYIDGTASPFITQGNTAGAQSSGNLFVGNCSCGPWSGQGGQFIMYRTRIWSDQKSAADITAFTQVSLSDVARLGVPTTPFPFNIGLPVSHWIGDSLTQGTNVSVPFPSLLTLTNQPTYTINNWGIGGVNLQALTASEPNRIGPQCSSTVGGPAIANVWGGTNDLSSGATVAQVYGALAGEVNVLKKAGCTVFVSTIIDRSAPNIATQKNALNAMIRTGIRAIGADGITDMDAPELMADGASTNATYFSGGGGIHPNNAGQVFEILSVNNAINYFFGANAANPTIITATTYSMTAGDGYINVQPTANTTFTLPDCIGQSGAIYTINNLTTAGFTIFVKNLSSVETINGVDYSTSGLPALSGAGTIKFIDVPNPSSTGGCHWDYLPASISSGITGSIGGSLLTAGTCATGTATITGAVVGSPVTASASDGSAPNALVTISASITSTNTATVNVCAIAAVTPTAKTYNVAVF